MNRELMFLKLLEHMTSSFGKGDGFNWTIESVTLFESGPAAIFRCWWRSSQPAFEASACMSLRWTTSQGFFLCGETCSMGPETTAACHALENRLQRAKNVLRKVG